MIRTQREMEVELLTTQYSEDHGFPEKSNFFHWTLALHKLNFPIATPIARRLLRLWSISRNMVVSPGFKCLYGNIHCDHTVGLNDTFFVDYANVYIGRNSGFSFQNLVITSTHETLNMSKVRTQEVVIGENVWITSRVIILPGVHIGRNSIIGAGSVVTHDIPPNTFAAGIPAKSIRRISKEDHHASSIGEFH